MNERKKTREKNKKIGKKKHKPRPIFVSKLFTGSSNLRGGMNLPKSPEELL